MAEDNNLNQCYDSECDMKKCFNPDHYNFICLDPSCEDKHCENHKHYNKELLKEYQEHTDFSQFDHTEHIDYNEDVDIKICSCDDCNDEDESCDDESCDCHTHEHHHSHEEDSC
ncbi:MAG: hypothetical protein BZ133_04700, partial [Methanosphaera sp. SHI613]